ncbi:MULTISPECIES: hypothetical protein [unclassified Caballeronia]|jgi:hypothetical protein|nr:MULTISPECIES: hypothetical protein [unclassified Caballeronia]
MNDVIIYHNPGFGAPRDTLAVIHRANNEPTTITDAEGKRV